MPNYPRYRLWRVVLLFTVTYWSGNDLLLKQIDLLREVVRALREACPFHPDA